MTTRIAPQRIRHDFLGKFTRHLVLHLEGDESIAQVRESPEMFRAVQADGDRKILRGDRITVTSPDSLTVAENMVAVKANAEGVWLSAPQRLISLEPEVLYQTEELEVVPVGNRYAVRHRSSGHTEGVLFDTPRAAEFSILKRQPRTNAA